MRTDKRIGCADPIHHDESDFLVFSLYSKAARVTYTLILNTVLIG